MTFDKAIARIPEAIEDVSVTLTDYIAVGEEPAHKSAEYSVQVRYDNGEIKVLSGDLVPHLTAEQIDALMGFMDDMRVKAEAEILP